jgi:hypothetical protein
VFTGWINVAGLPALSIPVATTPEGGGIEVQLIAETGRDVELQVSPILQGQLSPVNSLSFQGVRDGP